MSDPTPAQTLILWCLLARHGGAPQGEIVPAVRKYDREALVAAGLVAVEKRGRALVLSVTDKGWHWAGAHLDAPVPPNFRVLGDLLVRLGRHLRETGGTLADFIGAEAEPAQAVPAKAQRRTRAKAPTPRVRAARKPGPRQLRARIEDAYLALTGGERARAVRLSALRAELADLDRATVDGGLARILKGDGTARLSQLSDPKALTQAEREAAFSPAGEPFHLIWIQA
jgi:hypothetical protein